MSRSRAASPIKQLLADEGNINAQRSGYAENPGMITAVVQIGERSGDSHGIVMAFLQLSVLPLYVKAQNL